MYTPFETSGMAVLSERVSKWVRRLLRRGRR
jgi:hypothetical protein